MAKSKSKAPKRGKSKGAKAKTRKASTRPKAAAKRMTDRKAKKTKASRKGGRTATAAKTRAAKPKPVKARAVKRVAPAPTRSARSAAKTKSADPKRQTAAAAPSSAAKRPSRAPTLDRERRRATDPDIVPTPPSSLDLDRSASAARSGRAELAHKIHEHTSTGPALTAGDIDADWESAESVGDEAPGGDNPTPDQDVVDEIGRSLGVEYDDDEELQGGSEIEARDRKRWELDPASSDDFDEREE